jgi:hypothetical protein
MSTTVRADVSIVGIASSCSKLFDCLRASFETCDNTDSTDSEKYNIFIWDALNKKNKTKNERRKKNNATNL